MKKLLISICCTLGLFVSVSAQNETASDEKISDQDIERYVDTKLEIEYRNATFKALELTTEEILIFDPIFAEYMDAKDRLTEKKMRLLEDFRDEMKENDSQKNQDEDRADFIEDYWEVNIAESELRKDYFDIMEDKIPVDKAAKFFLWEEMVEGQMRKNILSEIIPTIVTIEMMPKKSNKADAMKMDKSSADAKKDWSEKKMNKTKHKSGKSKDWAKAKKEIEAYSMWVKSTDKTVDISHEYTSEGLTQIMTTLTALDNTHSFNVPGLKDHKMKMLAIAEDIKKDPQSIDHADSIEKAFTTVATLINNMTMNNVQAVNQNNDLMMLAEKINPLQLTTDQPAHIYNFFEAVNKQLKSMSGKKYNKPSYHKSKK